MRRILATILLLCLYQSIKSPNVYKEAAFDWVHNKTLVMYSALLNGYKLYKIDFTKEYIVSPVCFKYDFEYTYRNATNILKFWSIVQIFTNYTTKWLYSSEIKYYWPPWDAYAETNLSNPEANQAFEVAKATLSSNPVSSIGYNAYKSFNWIKLAVKDGIKFFRISIYYDLEPFGRNITVEAAVYKKRDLYIFGSHITQKWE